MCVFYVCMYVCVCMFVCVFVSVCLFSFDVCVCVSTKFARLSPSSDLVLLSL
jgi:hypothetical protein